MDDLRMANLEKLVKEVDHFLVSAQKSGVLPTEDRDGSWKLRVSDDSMSAWLETYPSVGRGAPLDPWEIIDAIEETGVLHLDREKVRQIVERCNEGIETTGENALVASGTPPRNPVEGTVEFLVPFEKVRLIDENDERSVDWKKLWTIPTVHAGTVIARIHPPREGTAGIDIYGISVPPPHTAPFRVTYGEGVIVSAENGVTEVLTARDLGQPVFRGGELDVLPVLVVDGDVNMISGDIDFIGSVIVPGSVTEGFSVKAGRDAAVSGSVFNACVEAAGSCIIQGGIVGEHSEVRAGEDIRAGFVEYGLLISGNTIEILGYTLFAALEARQSVMVQGKNRRGIIGGVTTAGTMIKTLSAGSAMEPKTLLEAGRDAVRNRTIGELESKLNELEGMIQKIELAMLSLRPETGGFDPEKLSEEEKGKLLLLAEYHRKVESKRTELAERIENERRAMLAERKESPLIKIRDRVYPNVTVKIRESQMTVSSAESSVRYTFDRKTGTMQKGEY